MRNIYTIVFVTFILLSNEFIAQINGCGTQPMDSTEFVSQPHYANNQYLINLLDSLGLNSTTSNRSFNDDVLFRIPIKIWNYRDDDGNGGMDMELLGTWVRELNQIQIDNVTGIRYYLLCDISNIDNSDHLNVTYTEAFNLSNNTFGLHQRGAINIHLVEELNDEDAIGVYLALTDGIFVEFDALITTMTHEIGHFFGLEHVHRNWNAIVLAACKSEPVDRDSEFSTLTACVSPFASHIKCESTGDALCDTPASLALNNSNTDLVNCVFIGNEVDIEGVNYNSPPVGSLPPNILNIMASGSGCRDFFSPMQTGVMLSNAFSNLFEGPAPDLLSIEGVLYPFDEHEPNDRSIWASEVFLIHQ